MATDDLHRPPVVGLGLDRVARLIGHYVWIERRTFELLGRWVPIVPELDVKVALARQAPHHAWHADLWEERLPRLQEWDVDLLIAPPNPGIDAFFAALAEPDRADQTLEKLVGAYRVLGPRLTAAYAAHLRRTVEVTDGPTIRCLRLVLRDELEDREEGEALVQACMATPTDADRAAAEQGRVERLVVAAGGLLGDVGIDG